MEFTQDEATRLRKMLAGVSTDPRHAARLFYDHLFRISPDAKALFVSDMTRQGDKLIATLNTVLLQIDTWSAIEVAIEELGMRHVAYGVLPEHYAPTGQALDAMFTEILGDAFTQADRAAWQKAYAAVSNTMIAAIERRKTLRTETRTGE